MRVRQAVGLALLALLAAPALGTAAVSRAPAQTEALSGTVQFNAVGDFGSGANARATFADIGARPGDLTLALGDLSYSTTLTELQWCDLVKQGVGEGYPFQLISGNHESNGQNGFIDAYATCLPNQLPGLRGQYGRQWWVDSPRTNPLVRFIAVSPGIPFPEGNLDYSAGSARYQWTAAAIDGARAAGIPWVVVGMHVPCLSVGTYSCTGLADLNSLLVAKKVDLVLSGHEHLYQRTHQIATSAGCSAVVPGTYQPACVVDTDSAFTKDRGTVFATVGTGGVESRPADLSDPELPWFAAVSAQNQNPAFGFLSANVTADRLDAQFVRSETGTFTDSFAIDRTTPPGNSPPVAVAGATCTDLTCSFSAAGSTDPDGSIVSYAWAYGDGTTGSGASTSHTYTTAGTYTATLTVTDDGGATATTTATATPANPPAPSVLASDGFARTLASGWGTADVGGAWTTTVPSAATASVGSGRGLLGIGAGRTVTATLGAGGSRTDLSVKWSTDKVATGSGLYVSAIARRVAGQGEYRAKVRHTSTGGVAVSLVRLGSTGAETVLASEVTASGLALAPNEQLAVRVTAVTTAGRTALQARVWRAGTTEPSTWLRTATDTTPGLQGTGGMGFSCYLSSSATNAPITVAFDDLAVSAVP